MTVADLIAELSKQPPHKTVRVVLAEVHCVDESGDYTIPLCELDADEAKQVTNEGSFVLVSA